MAFKKKPSSAKTTKSGLKSLLKKHATDETKYNTEIVNLPPGIQGGLAKLCDARLAAYKRGANLGEQYILLAGTVMSPKSHTYVPQIFEDGKVVNLPAKTLDVKGLRTQIMLPLCATSGKTADENVERALNELRLLGGEDATEDIEDEEGLIELLKDLVEEGVVFKFGTNGSQPTKDYPEPRVWENWYGTKGVEESDIEDDDDDEIEEDVEEEEEEAPRPKKATKASKTIKKKDPEPEPEDDEEEPEDDSDDDEDSDDDSEDDGLDALAEEAEKDDIKAQSKIEKMAKEAGISDDALDDEDLTWSDIVNMIREASGDEDSDEEEEEDEEDDNPSVGEVYSFKPPRAKKAIEVTVSTINKAKKTASVKTEEGKVYRDVAWDKLISE